VPSMGKQVRILPETRGEEWLRFGVGQRARCSQSQPSLLSKRTVRKSSADEGCGDSWAPLGPGSLTRQPLSVGNHWHSSPVSFVERQEHAARSMSQDNSERRDRSDANGKRIRIP
jgi:hypothetical protein